jgi:hypothetical protein
VKKTLQLKHRGLNTSKDTLNFEPSELLQMAQAHKAFPVNLGGKQCGLSQLGFHAPEQTSSPPARYGGPPCLNTQVYRSLIDSAKMKSRDNSQSSRILDGVSRAAKEPGFEHNEAPVKALPSEKWPLERLRYKRGADATKSNYKRMLKEQKFELGSPEFCKRSKAVGFLKSLERNSPQPEILREEKKPPGELPCATESTPKAAAHSGFLSSLQKIETVKYTALTVPAEGVNRMDTWKKAFQNVKIAPVSDYCVKKQTGDSPEQQGSQLPVENNFHKTTEERLEGLHSLPFQDESTQKTNGNTSLPTIIQNPANSEKEKEPEVISTDKAFLTGLKETMGRYKTRLERSKDTNSKDYRTSDSRRDQFSSNRWDRTRNGSLDVQVYKPLTKIRSKDRNFGSIEPRRAEPIETSKAETILNSSRVEEAQASERIMIRSSENLASLSNLQTPEQNKQISGVLVSEEPIRVAGPFDREITPPKIVLKSSCELIRIEDSDFNLRRSYYPLNSQIISQREQKAEEKRVNRSVSFNLETSGNECQTDRKRAKGSIKPILKKKSAPRVSIHRTHFDSSQGTNFAGAPLPQSVFDRHYCASGEHIRLAALKPSPHVYRNISGAGLATLFSLPSNQYQFGNVYHGSEPQAQTFIGDSTVWRGPQPTNQPMIQGNRVYRTNTTEGAMPGQRYPIATYHSNYSSVEGQPVRRESPLHDRQIVRGECLSERVPPKTANYVPRPRMVNCLF